MLMDLTHLNTSLVGRNVKMPTLFFRHLCCTVHSLPAPTVLLWITPLIHPCTWWEQPLCSASRVHTVISQLPPSLMSLVKDLAPCDSSWSFLRSQLPHPWNWRLEWILSALISSIPVLSCSLYCSVLTFSLGSIHGEVVSFCQRKCTLWPAYFSRLMPDIWSPAEGEGGGLLITINQLKIQFFYFNYTTFLFNVTETFSVYGQFNSYSSILEGLVPK